MDLNVFVEAADLSRAPARRPSCRRARAGAAGSAVEGGQFIGYFVGMRVDVFVPSIDFSWEASRTRVRSRAFGPEAWFLSAEALAVFKLLFFRTKDFADLERMLAVEGRRPDAAYVRRWIVDMMGEDDLRVKNWDELVAQFGDSRGRPG